jgi:hypothetical protein
MSTNQIGQFKSDKHRDHKTVQWRRSSRSTSGPGANCIEAGAWYESMPGGYEVAGIAVRDSKQVDGPVLLVSSHEWLRFLAAVSPRKAERTQRGAAFRQQVAIRETK